jgi:hypothetical protein
MFAAARRAGVEPRAPFVSPAFMPQGGALRTAALPARGCGMRRLTAPACTTEPRRAQRGRQPLSTSTSRRCRWAMRSSAMPRDAAARAVSQRDSGRADIERRARPVSPDAALGLLLEGTGLVAEKVRTGSGVTLALRPADAPATAPRAAGLGSLDGLPEPGAGAGVGSAVRRHAHAAGRVPLALALRGGCRGPGPAAAPARLHRRCCQGRRDAGGSAAVHLAQSPPPELPQPLTLLVLPTDSRGGTRCRGAAASEAS